MSKVNKELIENFYRRIVLPFVSNQLSKANFEGRGETEKTEFEQDFNKILDLAISALESPQGEWIPVSKRLPQNRDWYLGIFREVDTGWINPVPYICDYVGKETIGTTKAGWILKNITDEKYCAEYYKNLECICWQPLPVKPNIPDLEGGEEE